MIKVFSLLFFDLSNWWLIWLIKLYAPNREHEKKEVMRLVFVGV